MTTSAIQNGDGYTITGSSSSTWYSTCSSVTYFGGPNISGPGSTITRTFTGLPAHTSVMISFTYVYGDYWFVGDYAYLYADGVKVWENMGYKYEQNYTTDCGSYYLTSNPGWYNVTESIVDYSVSISHSASSITFEWTAALAGSYVCWFALRNVQLSLPCNNANCSTCNSADITQCVTCKPNYYLLGTTCYSPCPLRYFASGANCARKNLPFCWYRNYNLFCFWDLVCASYCNTCTGSSSSQCTSCVSGYRLYGNTCVYTCPSGTYATSTACLSNRFEPSFIFNLVV